MKHFIATGNMILGKICNTDCIFALLKLTVILILIFPASGRNKLRRQSRSRGRAAKSSLSKDFDHHSNFNTIPPEGPPTSSAYGNTREVTSILRSTVSRPGVRELDSNQDLNGKPSNLILPDTLPVSPSPSNTGIGACQYIVTFNKSPHCTQNDATISLATGGHTPITVTRAQLDDYEMRIGKLEDVIHNLSDSLPDPSDSPDSASEDGSKASAGKSNMRTIMQEMKDQLVLLEHGLVDLQDEKDSLKKENKNLILALRRASVARKNLVGIKVELERNLKRQKEEIATLTLANRTLTLQNTQLKGNYHNLESLKDSYRNRNSALGEEKAQLTEEVEGCKSERLALSEENANLKIRVRNLTAIVNVRMVDSKNQGALQVDLENEREKNEILMSRNKRLEEKLQNATAQIRELEMQISDATKMPNLDDSVTSQIITPKAGDSSTPTTIKDFTTCGKIVSISAPETIRGSRSSLERYGVWMMDPLGALGPGKVWWINTAKERVKEVTCCI